MPNDQKFGVIYTAGAYILWGFLPIYWKLIQQVPAFDILAHRILWSFVFMILIVVLSKKWQPFFQQCRTIWTDKKKLIGIIFASLTISINWVTYIWAVNSNHVIEASLGYYINPLVSILLGMIILKETFSKIQWIAFLLAGTGVFYMTANFGSVPWIALLLAFSFGTYGLLKKLVPLNAMYGLTIETLIVSPIALFYVIGEQGGAWMEMADWASITTLLLFGGGVVTAIPLLLFAAGAKRIPLSMVGFLQYLAPTIMLIIGIFMYDEPFTHIHVVSFTFIWAGLAVYTIARTKLSKKLEWNRASKEKI